MLARTREDTRVLRVRARGVVYGVRTPLARGCVLVRAIIRGKVP